MAQRTVKRRINKLRRREKRERLRQLQKAQIGGGGSGRSDVYAAHRRIERAFGGRDPFASPGGIRGTGAIYGGED